MPEQIFGLRPKRSGVPTVKSNNTIPATLDLTQSLETFKQTIIKELSLSDISQWDGRTFREREQKIRQAGLELAGQCIALLLNNLSQSPEAMKTAHKQTQGWRRPKSQGNGRVERQVLCNGNVLVSLRLPYVVERSNKVGLNRRKIKGQGFCPFLRWLSMEEGITPLVWSKVAFHGSVSGSFAIAQQALVDWGIAMSVRRVERLTYHFNQQGLSVRNSQIYHFQTGTLAITPVLKGHRVVISVDGGRTRIRENKTGKRRQQTNRHRYQGEWTEPKLLTIYVVDEQGKRVNSAEIPVTNDGTYGKLQPFLSLLEMHLVRLGINSASQVLLIADGAKWIWQHIPPLLQRLGGSLPSIQGLLDFYHATEHLRTFASQLLLNQISNRHGLSHARSTLQRGKSANLLAQMQALNEKMRGERRSIMTKEIQYFSKFHQQGYLSYSQVAAMNMPIGSGAIESLIRQVVNLRLKGNGKFWLLENAPQYCTLAVTGLRAIGQLFVILF